MTDDVATLVALLGREHWRIESVTVRLHVLRMAVSGEWPGSLDDADAGLADAIDRLRREELARAVAAAGCAGRLGLEPEATLHGLLTVAPPEHVAALLTAAEGLGHAIEGVRAAANEVTAQLGQTAFAPASASSRPSTITPAKAAALTRMVERIVPPSIERFLGLHVA